MRAEPEWNAAKVDREDAKEKVAPDKEELAREPLNIDPEIDEIEPESPPVLRADPDVAQRDEAPEKRQVMFRRRGPKRVASVTRKRLISPLTRKVLAVNFIAVLIPVAGQPDRSRDGCSKNPGRSVRGGDRRGRDRHDA
jgi:hypothetical protein